MQSQTYKPRDPKTPLDIDIDNIAYNETYEEDLEYYGMEEVFDPLSELSDEEWTVIWADEDEFMDYDGNDASTWPSVDYGDDDRHLSDVID
jgi:hypothetical protein